MPAPWLESVLAHWRDLMAAERVPHAVLLSGPEGVGKRLLAQSMAQALLCRANLGQLSRPCAQCDRCQQLEGGSHPDFSCWHSEPDSDVIRIDQIRALSHKLLLTAQYQGYKVAVVQQAEQMNAAAANALLKTLEEPDGASVLLLTSVRPGALPATIRSRCQRYTVPLPTASQSRDWLLNRAIDDPDKWLRLSRGKPLIAEALAQQAEPVPLLIEQGLSDLFSARVSPLQLAERFSKLPLAAVLVMLLDCVEQQIRAGMIAAANQQAPEALAQQAEAFVLRDTLFLRYRELAPGLNARTVLEPLLIELQRQHRA